MTRHAYSFPLLLTLAAPALAQSPGPIPRWLRAPGAQANFAGGAATYDAANAFLAMAHSVLTGPTDIGFSTWEDTATMRASYQTRIRAILQTGNTATYGSGATAIISASWGYDTVTFFRSALTDTEGYIASSPSHTIIAFRGSELSDIGSIVQDWAQTDFNAAPITLLDSSTLSSGTVHAGFLAAVLSVKDQIVEQLLDDHGYRPRFDVINGRLVQVRSTKPIWTTGYSLGGACATLSAFLIARQHGLPVRGTITGGAPMVGNAAFGNLYLNAGLQIYRHGNNLEIVPLGFGELARLTGDMSQTVTGVGNWIAGQFVEPVRTPMQLLVAALLAPANWVAGQAGRLSDIAALVNLNYAQFGDLRYFDRNANMSLNPSTNARQADRVATLTNGITGVLAQFLPPPPPSNPWDAVAWAVYAQRLAELAGRVLTAVANPGPYVAQIAGTFGQYVTDHSTIKQARLLFDRLPENLQTLASMPNRP